MPKSSDLQSRAVDPKELYLKRFYPTKSAEVEESAINVPDDDDNLSEFSDVGSEASATRGSGRQLRKIVASILMRILCVARMARFDLLRITCKLATRISRWEEQDDKRLLCLTRYIWHHNDDRQLAFIGDDVSNTSLHLFCDADFAGGHISQRSTSGVNLALQGPRTLIPLQGLSVKQDAVAFSTPEAEWYVGCLG